jgi:hypothetical protein
MEELLESTRAHGEHPGTLQLIIERQAYLIAAELEWLDTVIARLRNAHDETGVQGGNEV